MSYLSLTASTAWLNGFIKAGSQTVHIPVAQTQKKYPERNPIAIIRISTILRSTGNEKWLKHASDLACRFCSYGIWLRCFHQIILGFGDFSISPIPSMLKVLQALQSRLTLVFLLETWAGFFLKSEITLPRIRELPIHISWMKLYLWKQVITEMVDVFKVI